MSTAIAAPKSASQSTKTTPEVKPAAATRSWQELAVWIVLGLLFVASIWSVGALRINIASILDSVDNAIAFGSRMFPLDFPPIGELVGLILETLAIVFLATVLSVVLSIPVALYAASNTTIGKTSRGVSRAIIVLGRALPDLILAIVFMRMFGLGALPGIFATGIHLVGMVGKLLADAIESLDDGPIEAMRSTGAGRWQVITTAVLPPLFPQIIATALHRFDINLRTSVLLGYVGVGGIGLAISDALRSLNYQRGMALALVVLVLCIAIEFISGTIRASLLTPNTSGQTWADKVIAKISGNEKPQEAGRVSPPWIAERFAHTLNIVLLLVLLIGSFAAVDMTWSSFLGGLMAIPETVMLFSPPSAGGAMPDILEGLLVTIQIS